MRFGPAPIAPRRPAVPNSSRSPNRASRPSSSPAASSASISARVCRIGVLVAPRRGPGDERRVHHRSDGDGDQEVGHPLGGCLPGGEDLGMVEGLGPEPGGQVRHQRQGQDLGARLAGGDHLVDRRHPDEVAAQGPVGTDLRRRLVVRPWYGRVDALAELGSVGVRQLAEARGVGVGEIAEAGAPAVAVRRLRSRQRRTAGEVHVIGDEHGIAHPHAVARCRRRRW